MPTFFWTLSCILCLLFLHYNHFIFAEKSCMIFCCEWKLQVVASGTAQCSPECLLMVVSLNGEECIYILSTVVPYPSITIELQYVTFADQCQMHGYPTWPLHHVSCLCLWVQKFIRFVALCVVSLCMSKSNSSQDAWWWRSRCPCLLHCNICKLKTWKYSW